MIKALMAIVVTAVVLAAPLGVSVAAAQEAGGVRMGDKFYPPCKSRSDDRCVQVPGMGRMMDGEKMGMEKRMPAAPTPGIPRGCSPVTTPCE